MITHHDIDRMLIVTALVERVQDHALPLQWRSNWPVELIRQSANTAYGYTDASAQYQPGPEDIAVYDRMHGLLVEARKAVPMDRLMAVLHRYRILQNGIADETQMMPWIEVAQRIEVRRPETAAAYADEAMQWMVTRLNRLP